MSLGDRVKPELAAIYDAFVNLCSKVGPEEGVAFAELLLARFTEVAREYPKWDEQRFLHVREEIDRTTKRTFPQ